MERPVVAVFCMPEHGHFQQLRALIGDLARSGFAVHVFTHRRYAAEVERLGARLVDLFTPWPIEQADSESIPVPCRYVSFAAAYAEEVLASLRRLKPALVVAETFAVIGRLAARLLDLPLVNVMPGHNFHPALYLPALRTDPRVAISERCHRAVEILRERYGLPDASPFSYIAGLSPDLNICCEPAAFLTEAERKSFEPVAFYGCIPASAEESAHPETADALFGDGSSELKIYACLGTVAFRYYADVATRVLEALSDCVAGMKEARALVSLGGASVADGVVQGLRRPNVEIVGYADQWRALGEADLFLTHHGLNSTHEAVFRDVPMLSYPIFTDQPALAERCQQLGIALPLSDSLRGPVDAEQIRAGLEKISRERASLMAKLERVRTWELEVMAQRPAVLARVCDLASVSAAALRPVDTR
ncbi:glycosyltransferase [Hypericibacter adhaerens]|nr:glycosyltransferase [Hypericibacter adhaerens]